MAKNRRTANGTQRAGNRRFLAVLAVVAIMSAVVVFAIRNQNGPGPTVATSGTFGHIHGLAVDPGSTSLLVATHTGLYRVDDERTAVRVSKQVTDLMGFSVAGPRHFLASGHPGTGQDGPANLGLIESTDGGVTWQSISLSGAADFHGLQAAHGSVYGHNSGDGAFMVSTDRRTWDRRSTVGIGAFVVSPGDPQTVLAVGEAGLYHSDDGGRGWHPLAGTPAFSVLSWPAPGQVWGASADGSVWRSGDGGTTWQRLGQAPGEPHAMTVHDGTVLLALAGDKIVASADNAATWKTRYAAG